MELTRNTYMKEVYAAYLGKKVIVSVGGYVTAKGILADFNGAVLHVTLGDTHFYIPYDKVLMITGDL